MGLADSVRVKLVTELEAAKSEVKKTKADVDAMVVIYWAQVRAKEVVEVAQI